MIKQANKVSQEGVISPSIYAVAQTAMKYTVSITDNISDVFIYDEVLMLLENAEEQDEIVFTIASYGGQLASLLSLRSAILSTKATVTGKLVSHACSAAGMLLLSCHNKIVYPNTTFHCHTASYGTYGKSGDIKAQVDHETKQIEKLVLDVYDGFLDSEKEIPELLAGKEFYFDAEETLERLSRQEALKQQKAAQDIQTALETPIDLSEYSLEELEEELGLMTADLRDLKSEINKRKKLSDIAKEETKPINKKLRDIPPYNPEPLREVVETTVKKRKTTKEKQSAADASTVD